MTYIIENLRTFLGIGFLLLTAIAIFIRIRLCNEIGKITRDLEKADANVMQKIADRFKSKTEYKNALFSNKLAILELYYGEQQFWGFSYDNLTYFTRNLPNLLA